MLLPELEILLLCLRDDLSAEKIARLKSVSAAAWQAVAGLARDHFLAPLLHYRLKLLGITLPENVAERLKRAYILNSARNIRLYRELEKILQRLSQENIPVIVLKGAYLAQAVYADLGLRPMADIDLLIPAGVMERAIDQLKSCGFTPWRTFYLEPDSNLYYHAPEMVKNEIIVEPHWTLAQKSILPQIDPEGLWARALKTTMGKSHVWALSPGDLILHLAVHLAYKHHFSSQLLSLYDIKEVLQKFKTDLNWPAIIQNCQAWQAQRGMYLALRLVGELFGIEVPEQDLEALRPADWTEKALEWAKIRLFQTHPVLSENFIRVMHGSRLSERLAALVKGLFPSRAVMAMLYGVPPGSWRMLALYPRHAATRIQIYWGYAWKLLHGDRSQAIESLSDQSLRDWLGITS